MAKDHGSSVKGGMVSALLRRQSPRALSPRELRRILGVEEATRRLLLGFIAPLWIASGLADWACHRRSDIEHTAGVRESAVHALMMSEASVPILLGLFFEVEAGVLIATLGALGLHQATAVYDVAFAESRREVTTTEQHVHGLLEQVPVMATAFLFALHWDQARAIAGGDGRRPRLRLRPKRRPLSRRAKASLLGAIVAFGAAPYTEELVRCVRARRAAERLLLSLDHRGHPAARARTPSSCRSVTSQRSARPAIAPLARRAGGAG